MTEEDEDGGEEVEAGRNVPPEGTAKTEQAGSLGNVRAEEGVVAAHAAASVVQEESPTVSGKQADSSDKAAENVSVDDSGSSGSPSKQDSETAPTPAAQEQADADAAAFAAMLFPDAPTVSVPKAPTSEDVAAMLFGGPPAVAAPAPPKPAKPLQVPP